MGTAESNTRAPDWRRRVPNALTALRLAMAGAVFGLLTIVPAQPQSAAILIVAAAALFVVAAATDALDGYLARRWNAVSVFGRIMDPFADKFLVLGSFVFLAGPAFLTDAGASLSGVAPWMAVAILARELLVTTIRGLMESQGVDFSASWPGKLKMIVQSIAVPIILLAAAAQIHAPDAAESNAAAIIARVTAWATVIVTIWSMLPYVVRAARAAKGFEESIDA